MRNYQPKRNNPYRLPHNVYMQCLYAIRDYARLKEERLDILHSSPIHDGQPGGSEVADVTANKAIRLEQLSKMCEDVEQALIQVPEEYRKGVMDNILYGVSYPLNAYPDTYRRWRYRLVYFVAKNKGIA